MSPHCQCKTRNGTVTFEQMFWLWTMKIDGWFEKDSKIQYFWLDQNNHLRTSSGHWSNVDRILWSLFSTVSLYDAEIQGHRNSKGHGVVAATVMINHGNHFMTTLIPYEAAYSENVPNDIQIVLICSWRKIVCQNLFYNFQIIAVSSRWNIHYCGSRKYRKLTILR